jgi:hypothetical protein
MEGVPNVTSAQCSVVPTGGDTIQKQAEGIMDLGVVPEAGLGDLTEGER